MVQMVCLGTEVSLEEVAKLQCLMENGPYRSANVDLNEFMRFLDVAWHRLLTARAIVGVY